MSRTDRRRPRRPGLEPLEARALLAANFDLFPITMPVGLTPESFAAAPDGDVWFADGGYFGSFFGLGRISPSGDVTTYPMPESEAPELIDVAADGTVWFADTSNGGDFGTFSPANGARRFPIQGPSGPLEPRGLAAAPDGSAWVLAGSQVGRLTTSGQFTSLATLNVTAHDLAIGPDGALWFTAYSTRISGQATLVTYESRVGRVDTSGAVTLYDLPDEAAGPSQIVAGPDGALWFTEPGTQKIGRITTAGQVREFAVPGLASGDHLDETIDSGAGAVWFLTARGLGRVTPDGSVSVVEVPGGRSYVDDLGGLAVAEGGGVWFTDPVRSSFGRFDGSATTYFDFPSILTYPPGDPPNLGQIVAGPDGALWFTDTNSIGRIDLDGQITRFPASGAFGGGLVAGSDGALWFLDSDGPVRLSTDGQVTRFRVPDIQSNDRLSDLVSGPDGALWFLESSYPSRVVRMTTSGDFRTFPLHDVLQSPRGLGVGPDGALWFGAGSVVVRITTGGDIRGFPMADPPDISDLVAGPDGAIWFVSMYGPGVYRMTTDGRLTEFPILPDRFRYLREITVGPDGNLWITVSDYSNNTSSLVRMTTTGTTTYFAAPVGNFSLPNYPPFSSAGVYSLATGPDGNLWFTLPYAEGGRFYVGRLRFDPAPEGRGLAVDAYLGGPIAAVVATFAAPDSNARPEEFLATISWGDGTLAEPGAVVANASGGFDVLGLHTFRPGGPYRTTVTFARLDAPEGATVQGVVRILNNPTIDTTFPQPTLLGLQREGVHRQPTRLVLRFDISLDPSTASDPARYHLVSAGRDHRLGTRDDRAVPIASAAYQPGTTTLALFPADRLSLRARYRLTVTDALNGTWTWVGLGDRRRDAIHHARRTGLDLRHARLDHRSLARPTHR